jgi:hypothetical protein
MPKLQDDRPCVGYSKDFGPQAEVEAVRRLMRGPLVPYVAVSDGWAMGDWYGAGGGETLYQLRNGVWVIVAGGGGAMGISEMRQYHVPEAAWCAFGIYGATCPKHP